MRKTLCLLGATALAAGLVLSGCGGSSSGSSSTTVTSVTRYVAGFVWVRGDAAVGTGPEALITASSAPPAGYFAPTAGTVTLSVADGTITRAPASEAFNMATDNKIIALVQANSSSPTGPFNMTVSASGLQFNGNPRTLASTSVSLGTTATSGTTLALAVGTPPDPPLQPGPPASIEVLVRDREGDPGTSTNPFRAPLPAGESFVAGTTFDVAIAVFDADGTAITGLTPVVTSSAPSTVGVVGAQLVPATNGTEGSPVTITTTISSSTVATSFGGTYTFGTATSVEILNLSKPTLLWDTSGPVDSATALVKVENQYGVPIPNVTVSVTSPTVDSSNDWIAPASGTALAFTGTTNASGEMTLAITSPTSAAGNSSTIANNPPKGANTITATVGSVSDSITVTIVRPLSSLTITGPTRLDTGEVTAIGDFSITGGVDVDGVSVATPSGTPTWSVVNTPATGNIGNPDDLSPREGSAATINASNGVLTTGPSAGEATVSAQIGSVSSNNLVVQIHGAPTKMVYTPATAANGYEGAPGTEVNFTVSFIDNWGRPVIAAELTNLTKSASTTSSANSNITWPPAPDLSFLLTIGASTGGSMTVNTGGTWGGRLGTKNATFSLSRTTNIVNP
ncbi:MAG: hypothetical protein SNJ61_03030 [Fimbriimonadaceae bacterium]